MKIFGLIGYPLTHSFSKKYFTEKFQRENLQDCTFLNFEISSIEAFPKIIDDHAPKGVNVTIPYKQQIIPYLDRLDKSAEFVGAVNVVKVLPSKELVGYNSDYYGFLESLRNFLPSNFSGMKALILGTGGAAKAVEAALKSLGIPFTYVSRHGKVGLLEYQQLDEAILREFRIIINASPVGTFPNVDSCPAIPYEFLGTEHYLYDLVYNPEMTLFLKKGVERGAHIKNGLEMLHLQAEKAWEIWNT